MRKDGVFHNIGETSHLHRQSLLKAQLIRINDSRCSNPLDVIAATHGPSVQLTVLVPRAEPEAPEAAAMDVGQEAPAEFVVVGQEAAAAIMDVVQ